MGFADLLTDSGLTMLNSWLTTRSYIIGYSPSQADVVTFKGLGRLPLVARYPHAYRWYKHIASYQSDFSSLPGDPPKAYTTYGPDATELAINPKDTPDTAVDDEDGLFGSDEEEDDLAAYKKKEGKAKPTAKSIITIEVVPWDGEVDRKKLEQNMRKIEMDGLVWGASKLVYVGFGIHLLRVDLVIEDEKVSINDLQVKIEEEKDYVQKVNIFAMYRL